MQGGEEAGDLGLEEPDSLAEDGRPVLFRLVGLLRRSQLFLRQPAQIALSPARQVTVVLGPIWTNLVQN